MIFFCSIIPKKSYKTVPSLICFSIKLDVMPKKATITISAFTKNFFLKHSKKENKIFLLKQKEKTEKI